MKIIRSKTAISAGATVALAAVVAVSFAAAATSGSTPAQAASSETDLSRATDVLSTLADEQQADDNLPPEIAKNSALADIVLDSTHLLGTDENASYFTAGNTIGEVCLFIVQPDGWSAHTCSSADRVDRDGLWVQLGNRDNPQAGARAYLVPDGDEIVSKSSGLTQLSPNLLVGRVDVEDHVVVRGADGALSELKSATPMNSEG